MTLPRRTLLAALLVSSTPAWAIENVLIFNAAGNGTTTASGDGNTAVAAGLARPVDVGADGNGNWYILDAGSKSVRKVAPDNTITTVAALPAAGNGMAVGKDGTLFVSMPSELRRIAPNGAVTSYPQTATGLAVDGSGVLYFADPTHHVVRKLSTAGQITIAAGDAQSTGVCADGATATGPCLNAPSDVAVGADGTLYIADPGNQGLWKVIGGAIYSGPMATTAFSLYPSQLTVTKEGRIFLTSDADGHTSVKWLEDNGSLVPIAGTGYAGDSGDGGQAEAAQLDGIGGLYSDVGGNLYIADTNNHRVRRLRIGATPHAGYDLNNDYLPDLVWRNRKTGQNSAWNDANSRTMLPMAAVTNLDWEIVGGGNFDGADGLDILWRNRHTGANAIWRSGNAATQLAIPAVTNVAWKVAGIGEFDGAAKRDILWRNVQTGANVIWRAGSASSQLAVATAGTQWQVAGIGDFGGDGRSDILWRNPVTGANAIWRSGSAALPQAVPTVGPSWQVAAIGDFDGDGRSDIFWRNTATGADTIWRTGDYRMPINLSMVNLGWSVANVADYDENGMDDVLWREAGGANAIWTYAGGVETLLSWLPATAPDWVPAR